MAASTYGIGLYAPAGFVTEPVAITRAIALLEALGHRVVVDPTVTARWQRFSAPDPERLAAVRRMADDPRVDLAIAVRGGYGWSRLLEQVDFKRIAESGKRWMGHSDFTAFQMAALTKAAIVSFAGPMVAYDFGAGSPSAFTLQHCWGLLGAEEYSVECALDGPRHVAAQGTLWGGNLAMIAHLAGTSFLPRIDSGILFVEDVGEHPYRIERMFYQLHFAGILQRQRAILIGDLSGFELVANDNGYGVDTMVSHLRQAFAAPIFPGLPFGHCRDKLTLPVGGQCALEVGEGAARLTFSAYT
jgi:muramoyltetrapeptide carboxypeptidase